MFEVGEKVIIRDNIKVRSSDLQKGKVYNIEHCSKLALDTYFLCRINKIPGYLYNVNMFISLTELRRKKINKICLKLDTK